MKKQTVASILFILLFFLFNNPPAAAADFKMTAAAVDTLGQPDGFVTWRVFSAADSVRPVKGAVSGDDGLISTPLPHRGDYRLVVVGMNSAVAERQFSVSDESPVANLGVIVMPAVATELAEITVTAQRPLVIKEIDRLSYDVLSDTESQTAPLLDILRKVPLVSVDAEGNIKVNGSDNFTIYKNGRPNNSFSKNAKDIFRALPASTIKKIEVITDPGAREDAEGVGAILNIVTASGTSLKGVTGSVGLYADINNPVPQANAYLTTQIDKVTFSVMGSYWQQGGRRERSNMVSDGTYISTGDKLYTNAISRNDSEGGWGSAEGSWEPDTMNLVTMNFDMYSYNFETRKNENTLLTQADGNPVYSFSTFSHYPTHRYTDLGGAINYQRSTRRKDESITASYRIAHTNQKQVMATEYSNMVNAPMDYTGINSHFDLNFLEQTFQLDWSRPYGRIHKLDLGAKFIQRNNDSRNTRYYTGAGNTYDDFTHRTSIGAVYADWRATFGRVSLRAGIRYEYSHLSAKFRTGDMRHFGSNLNDFAPNAAVNWNINDANTLKLSYNRRINRPGISYLDPTVSVSPLVTSSGNPDLGSSAYNAVTLNYTLIRPRITLDASVSGTISNNAIAQVKTVENQHTYYTYDNVDHYRQLRLSAYAQWTPWDKTRIVVNASGGPVRYHRPSAKLSETVWQSHIYLNIQQTIPWKIILRANAGFFGGYGSLYTRSKNNASSIWHSIGVQRNFLKEDRLSVSIFINNPFGPNTLDYTSETFNTDYVSRSTTTYNYRRDVGISIRYRFGSLTASVKKTKASISNDDLTGGKK